MPLRFPTETFFTSSGNAAAQFQEAVRDGIADFACSLWAGFPGFITNNKNPVSSFARGYMNSICQNRVTLPTMSPAPFTGGQCPGVNYKILASCQVEYWTWNNFTFAKETDVFPSKDTSQNFPNLVGPISEVYWQSDPPCPSVDPDQTDCTYGGRVMRVYVRHAGGLASFQGALYTGGPFTGAVISTNSQKFLRRDTITNQNFVISRLDGQPDNCGDAGPRYDPTPPTTVDLSTTIIINSQDGDNLNLNLTYNQLSNEFNFPMGFKFEGVNVTLDFSGITIYGDESYTTPNNGNEPLPPGTDGGDNGIDGPYVETYPEQPWPVLPEFTLPKATQETFETAVCNEGVISLVNEVAISLPGLAPPLRIILSILVALLEEICTTEQVEAIVGFPEYYGVKPGAERPAIVYLYKTWDGTNYGASTYSATVNNPSTSAVAEIETVQIPNKTIGTFIASITLTNGTRLRASGSSKPNAIANLNFLIGKADPAILPANLTASTVVTEDTRLNVVDLVCRQIEYYPNGAGANKTPSIRRVIDQ